MSLLRGVVFLSLVLVGCGGSVTSNSSASGGSAGTGGAVGSGGSAGESSLTCQAATGKLMDELGSSAVSCTVAVRLSSSFAVQGYAMFCGRYAKLDESAALDRSKTDTGRHYSCTPVTSLTGAHPSNEFVFLWPATDGQCACCSDGWLTTVSARSGLTVFGAPLLLSSNPNRKGYPTTWKPASDLASGCPAPVALPSADGFDFTSLDKQGAPLDNASIRSALRAVWQTGLPAAYAKQQYVFDAVVLRYRSLLVSNSAPNYVVLVNSGWLEQ